MKMPSKIKKKWLKALRSGEYGQTKGVLTNGKGGFCCLGVLQHVVSGGKCETLGEGKDAPFQGSPSVSWYQENNIEVDGDADIAAVADTDEYKLMCMNDGEYHPTTGRTIRHSFKTIANWIEKNIQTTD